MELLFRKECGDKDPAKVHRSEKDRYNGFGTECEEI